MDFYTFGLSLDPHVVHQRHVLYDDSDEETDTENVSIDPQLRVKPEVNCKLCRIKILSLTQYNSGMLQMSDYCCVLLEMQLPFLSKLISYRLCPYQQLM